MTIQEAIAQFPRDLTLCFQVEAWRHPEPSVADETVFLPAPDGRPCVHYRGATLDEAVAKALAAVAPPAPPPSFLEAESAFAEAATFVPGQKEAA